MKYKYKFLNDLKSVNGCESRWELKKWRKIEGELTMCKHGYHCSKEPLDALYYVKGNVVALVETRGKSIVRNDKECWSEMRIVKICTWTQRDSVLLAVYAARQVLPIYEKKYPQNNCPRKTIEAAEKWADNPTKKNTVATYAAYAAAHAAAHADVNRWMKNYINNKIEAQDKPVSDVDSQD